MKHAFTLTAAALLVACGGADTSAPAPSAPAQKTASKTADTADYGSGTEDAGAMAGHNSGTPDGNAALQRASFQVVNSKGLSIGSVTVADTPNGVNVMLDVNAIPQGTHAIHFHETGTCDGPDFKSAGGHYNPSGVNHGFEAAKPNTHAGDMRNFDAPQSGVVKTTLNNDRVTLAPRSGLAPLYDGNGTALIIHAGADDYQSQPSGDAGGRIACAVIAP